ncbi:MAG: AmmeMemoRadiSam system protein B, partial [Actinomycetia bacterium]|nr:AmmeMemoRadiSam system protein B [Actinomycetes bacterium]
MKKRDIILVSAVFFLVVLGCLLLVKPEMISQEVEKMSSFVEGSKKIRSPYAAKIGFYPDSEESLRDLLSHLLSQSFPENIPGKIKALIVPHAGYRYSGLVAAQAYKQLEGKDYKTVIILGPSHQVPLAGAAIGDEDYYVTPLGNVFLDKAIAKDIATSVDDVSLNSAPLAQEHSIEVQIPFLQMVLGEFKIVPIALGEIDMELIDNLGKAISRIARGKDVLLIASSDMSHYHAYENAVIMDNIIIEEILKKNPDSLHKALTEKKGELCGASAVLSIITASKWLNLQPKLLKYMNSGDITGDEKEVVGYTSIAFYEKSSNSLKSEKVLSGEDEKAALDIARKTLQSYFENGIIPEIVGPSPGLLKKLGAFVTLKKDGKLRGCIGHIEADTPLFQLISKMAISSAIHDPRFSPVQGDE